MRLALRAIAALILGSLAFAVPASLEDIADHAAYHRRIQPALRPLAAAFQTDIDRTYLLAAKAYIPPNAAYYFDQGNRVVSGNPVSASAARPVTGFSLYPRRPVRDPSEAGWLICYGCNLDTWKDRLRIVWSTETIAIGRLER